ncbi:MAG: DUF2975 domain-containing protein [Bacillota bacterium]
MSLKQNFFIKSVYAYTNLFKKLFPVVFIAFLLLQASASMGFGKFDRSVDFFDLLGSRNDISRNNLPVSFETWIMIIVANVLCFIVTYIAVIKLDKFFKNVFNGQPFVEENGHCLKFIGWMVIIMTFFLHVKDSLFISLDLPVSDTVKQLVNLSYLLSVFFNPYLVLGLFCVALGEVIIHGSKMKEELDLTV